MAILLPPGTQITIDLPDYSLLPNNSDDDNEVQPLIVAALCTSHFPQAREQHLNLINRNITRYHYSRPLNRAQRRRQSKANR